MCHAGRNGVSQACTDLHTVPALALSDLGEHPRNHWGCEKGGSCLGKPPVKRANQAAPQPVVRQLLCPGPAPHAPPSIPWVHAAGAASWNPEHPVGNRNGRCPISHCDESQPLPRCSRGTHCRTPAIPLPCTPASRMGTATRAGLSRCRSPVSAVDVPLEMQLTAAIDMDVTRRVAATAPTGDQT
jgi:hypothetical protein